MGEGEKEEEEEEEEEAVVSLLPYLSLLMHPWIGKRETRPQQCCKKTQLQATYIEGVSVEPNERKCGQNKV